MGELTDELRDFLDGHRVGVLATIAADGKPRQSVVYYIRDADRLLISTESNRRKARDAQRTGWASVLHGDEQPYPSATFSGSAEILTEGIGPATAAVMQRVAGLPEAPEPQSDEALAAVDRVVLAIAIEQVSASATSRSRLTGSDCAMETVIWVAQVVLAIVFAFAGGLKLTQPREKLISMGQGWVETSTIAG